MAGSSGSQEGTSEAGGWWGSWITSAKSKSAEVYSMMRKDLDEIGTAVRSEASHVYSTTSTVIGKTLKLDEPESPANVMKKSLSTFIGQVSTVLNPEPDDDDTEVILSTGDTTMLSTYKRELETLQRLDATFLVPADSPELDAWRASLESAESGCISVASAARRLRAEPLLNAQYEKLVPSAIDDNTFWQRYLFRVALLQDRLAAASRRQAASAADAGVAAAAELPPATDPVLAHLPSQADLPVTRSPEKTTSLQKSSITKTASTNSSPVKSSSAMTSPAKSTPSMTSPVKSNPSMTSPVKSTPSMTTPVKSSPLEVSPSEEVDEGVAWEDEDFASDVELTEEQQTLLLQEYEKEIANKKQQKVTGAKDLVNNNLKTNKDNQNNAKLTPKTIDSEAKMPQTALKPTDDTAKEQETTAVTIDNKVSKSQSFDKKSQDKTTEKLTIKTSDNKTITIQKNAELNKDTTDRKLAKSVSDLCGNNLVEDYFENKEKKVKDDASSNSDESWEKEFDIEEQNA